MISIDQIQRILIVGAGTMGQQIGLQCALHGYDVVVYDVAAAALAAARQRMAGFLAEMVHAERLTRAAEEAALTRLTFDGELETAVRNVDLVSESVPEDPMLKGRVFAQLHELCPPHTIFTTNSSTLLPSMFAQATGRPSQFCAFHFHLPVWVSNVVDVMPHPDTDPALPPLLAQFAARIGQIPIMLEKEQSGYVFNTMLNALSGAAMELVVKGVAAPQTVDRAWMGVMKTPIGPFGILDSVGLDTVWKIVDYWATALDDPRLQAQAALLKSHVDAGRLGAKTGQGFYAYPDPAYQQPGFLTDVE